MNNYAGTPLYMAPELWQEDLAYDSKVDIWAVGVVLHEMLYGALPFKGQKEILNKDLVLPSMPQVSEHCKDLLTRMLNKNAKLRPSTEQCLKHPFFSGMHISFSQPLSSSYSNSLNNLANGNSPPPTLSKSGIDSMFSNSEEMKQEIDQSILMSQQGHIKDRLDNYFNVCKSLINVVKHVREFGKDQHLMTSFMVIKRCYYHAHYMYSHLTTDTFPKDLMPAGYLVFWDMYVKTDEYRHIRDKYAKFVIDGIGKVFERSYLDLKGMPVDMSKSYLSRAINNDIKNNFNASFKMVIDDAISDYKNKTMSSSITKEDKDTYYKLLIDLHYLYFVDDNIKNGQYQILFENYDNDSKNFSSSDIVKAIKSPEEFFSRYLRKFGSHNN